MVCDGKQEIKSTEPLDGKGGSQLDVCSYAVDSSQDGPLNRRASS